jgi:hypothetical protein
VLERRAHEPVAIVEVVVDQRDGDARLGRDLLDAQAPHAAARDHLDRRFEDGAPAVAHGAQA